MNSGSHCVNHPGAAGIALCVGCRSVLCGSCTTRIQGRNLCAECVEADLEEQAEPSRGAWGVAVHLAVVAGGLIAVSAVAAAGFALHALG